MSAPLPEFRRLTTEDMRGAGAWVTPMLNNYNNFNEGVYKLLNRQLSIGANLSGMTFTTTFTTKSDYATGGWAPILFNYTGSTQPSSCMIGQIQQINPSVTIITATSLDWTYNSAVTPPQVIINYVAGLLPLTTYTLTVVLL